MDRTAVLSRHKDAVLASTLNHTSTAKAARKGNSLLPLLAREYASDASVEALLRPRMPILQTGRKATATETETEAMDEDEESASEAEDDEENDIPADTASEVPEDATSSTHVSSNKDVADKEQELVNWALNEYVSSKNASKESDAEPMEGATQENRVKRQREDDEVKAVDKRQKSIEPQVAAAAAAEDSDDDDEFVVPEIVMGESDDEDE